jgi:sugar-specific transcriptional regulator TrmB
MKVLKRLERERDEARAELADHKSALEIANRSADDQMRQKRLAERERDEAREALREMWQSGDAFLPHVDSETINRWRKAAGWDGTK